MDDNYIVCQGKVLDLLLVVVLYSQCCSGRSGYCTKRSSEAGARRDGVVAATGCEFKLNKSKSCPQKLKSEETDPKGIVYLFFLCHHTNTHFLISSVPNPRRSSFITVTVSLA